MTEAPVGNIQKEGDVERNLGGLVVAVDIDNVLRETNGAMVKALVERFPEQKEAFTNCTEMDLRKAVPEGTEGREAILAWFKGHWGEVTRNAGTIEGASETINGWIRDGIAVHLVTTNPESDRLVVEGWLKNVGLEILASHERLHLMPDEDKKGGVTNPEFKARVVKGLNAHMIIDDSPDIIEGVDKGTEHFVRAVTFAAPWNKEWSEQSPHHKNVVRRYDSWGEINKSVRLIKDVLPLLQG